MQDTDQPQLIALALTSTGLAVAIGRVWAAGDAVFPIDPRLPEAVREGLLRRARPARLIDASGERVLPDPAGVEPGTAAVVATSGTTRQPKLAELTHAALNASASASDERTGAQPGDRWLCALPLHHIAGLGILVRSLRHGSAPVVQDRFDVEAFEAEREAAMVSLVPTMLRRLLDTGADLARFRAILLGGMRASEELVARAREAGANVIVTYGMTETCGGCVYDGTPLRDIEARIRGGAIEISGPVLLSRYRNEPERTEAVLRDGWFRTGDTGSIGSGGRLVVAGRTDDVIVTGGEKVAPGDVEAALAAFVDDAVVFGVPDDEWGERVVAAVVGPIPATELQARLRAALAPYQVPRQLLFLPEIPCNAGGKPDRRALARLATTSSGSSAPVL